MKKTTIAAFGILATCALIGASTRSASAQEMEAMGKSKKPKLPPGAKIILVDDDRQQFRNAPFSLINNAILAANAGDVIRVAPGIYRENVILPKLLRLEGAQAGKSAADKKRLNAANDANESVVQPVLGEGDGTGIRCEIPAQASTIDGFTVRGFATAGSDQIGIAGGGVILNNRVIDTTIGLGYSLVNNVIIQGNAFLNNRSKNGAALPGYGVYFEGSLTTALIDKNVFAGNSGANIFSGVPGATDVTISNNLMGASLSSVPSGAASILGKTTRLMVSRNAVRGGTNGFVSPDGVLDSFFVRNEFLGLSGTAISLSNNVRNNVISQNKSSGGSGIALQNLQFNNQDGEDVNAFNTISKNTIINGSGIGIFLQGTLGNKVEKNILNANLNGITLVNTSDNQVLNNTINGNRADGINVRDNLIAIGGNVFVGNKLRGNGNLDINDLTTGDGTSGTDNIYRNNKAQTSNPPELARNKK